MNADFLDRSTKKFEIWNWEKLYTVAIHSEIWTFDYAEKQSPKMWCSAKIDTYPREIDEVCKDINDKGLHK